ncbi:MAG: 1-deoxy-D-xylulose-5-phosphate reductoisomerase, partial [Phycisphaerales bacterium]
GSTGSIGRSTLDVLASMPHAFEVVGLAAGSQADVLAEQASRFHPQAVAIAQSDLGSDLDASIAAASTEVLCGTDSLVRLVDHVDCDCVVSAVVGADGLLATLRAVEQGRRVALANKEALVIAGSLLMPLARKTGATIIPVDSEHSAIFQALQAGRPREMRRIYLTASGGPFRTFSVEAMKTITVEDALNHPTWDMGPKITIDSATMMNKALEVVEARWLFDSDPDQIEVVIHPESVIHSVVEFCDGSLIAQLGTPDMRTPIQYALTYPDRWPCPSERLDFAKLRQLSLEPPDLERFPALQLGYEAAKRGGTAGAVLNAANEAAVHLFREGTIQYGEIARQVERALVQHDFIASPTLDDLLTADRWARREVTRCVAC